MTIQQLGFKRGVIGFLVGSLLSLSLPAAQETSALSHDTRPLPAVGEVLERLRDSVRSDRTLLSEYTYTETEETVRLDKQGAPKKTETKVYEVFPSFFQELTYRRLVSKDGTPVEEDRLRRQDSKQDKRLAQFSKQAEKNGKTYQSALEAAQEEARDKEDRQLEEISRLYEFRVQGREELDGHTALLLTFEPRPDYEPKIKGGAILKKLQGQIWVNEEDYQLVRVEAEVTKSVKLGFGILANLKKGTNFVFQRRLVNDEIWLPALATLQANGRILFGGLRLRMTTEYSDYKKFTVGTKVSFAENQ